MEVILYTAPDENKNNNIQNSARNALIDKLPLTASAGQLYKVQYIARWGHESQNKDAYRYCKSIAVKHKQELSLSLSEITCGTKVMQLGAVRQITQVPDSYSWDRVRRWFHNGVVPDASASSLRPGHRTFEYI